MSASTHHASESTHYDVVIIGSGFGGSVSALRLTEKGYRVGVLEAGRRFADHELPTSSWKARDYLWAPGLGCKGILRTTLLKDVLILSGAGVGGGSLVYANTLYEPPTTFFGDPHWAHITNWADELGPAYDQAKRMLGATTYPKTSPADEVMQAIATDLGVEDTYHPTEVGVLFGERPGRRVPDPFFGGVGPERTTCTDCGECMTGCRHGAKNTLVKNYLYLAEQAGARVHPETTVTDVRPRPGGGYQVRTRRTGGVKRATFTADQVIFSAAALGTQRLLHKLRDTGSLPAVSRRLGELSRTNSEAILAARSRRDDVDFTRGVAITSSIHLDEVTHVEPVRYGRGSNALGLLMASLTDAEPGRSRFLLGMRQMWANRRDLARLHNPKNWSKQTITLLVMQSADNSLTTRTVRRPWGRRLTSRQGIGEPNPIWLPNAHDATRRVAEKIDGIAGGTWADLANIPLTGHFIGGCPIGLSPDEGVVDPYHRLFGHPGLHVIDGSVVAANLGVNPSLTITAMAERAVSLWPNKGEPDRRPALGAGYQRLAPIAPAAPVVPPLAPAAYRLSITPV